MKKYIYVGDGAGVPGLPHEITDEEAEALGLTELLEAAVENGNYRETDLTPRPPSLKGRGSVGVKSVKKDSEVNDE